jgi:hypothetical protein
MKTKNLYIIGIGIISLLFLIILVVIPFLIFFQHIWIAISMVLALSIIGLLLYMINSPGSKMNMFYNNEKVEKIRNHTSHRFTYRKPKYPFSCGQAAVGMLLENCGITITEDEILALSGDKTLGTTAQELRDALNTIFAERNIPFEAKVHNYTHQTALSDCLERGFVIVMYINEFHEDGYPAESNYPHFALVNGINSSEGWIQLTIPAFSPEKNPAFKMGMPEGEVRMPLFPEFQERFYMGRYLKKLRYKPTIGIHPWYTRWWNYCLNFLFIFAMYIGYCTKILKPGLAICVEPVDK